MITGFPTKIRGDPVSMLKQTGSQQVFFKMAAIDVCRTWQVSYENNVDEIKVAVNVSRREQTFPQIMADFSLFVH